MNPKFENAFAYRSMIAEVTRRDLAQTSEYTSLSNLIAETSEPIIVANQSSYGQRPLSCL